MAFEARRRDRPAETDRWGRPVEPSWVHGVAVSAPSAGQALVQVTVAAGRQGFFYGFLITAGEANDFLISWTSGGSGRSTRIIFGGKGTIQSVSPVALNEGLPADAETTVTIANFNAGSSGVVYQARLLYLEVS